ncbi:hypothetical protein [Pelagibacterium sediminicola]|uniref:hypothetical protein n=1 Tax=Pelagibacterium sediminicola TaxID=2248761 RepID=UPI000E315F5E|nr:hypothetical protein [Pelagibacterium sediminicola]
MNVRLLGSRINCLTVVLPVAPQIAGKAGSEFIDTLVAFPPKAKVEIIGNERVHRTALDARYITQLLDNRNR